MGLDVKGRRLLLNRRLVQAPIDTIDYVITHELCHIIEPSHSPKYYKILGRAMHDWGKTKGKAGTVSCLATSMPGLASAKRQDTSSHWSLLGRKSRLLVVSFIELKSVPTRRNCRDEVRVVQREIPHQTPANFPSGCPSRSFQSVFRRASFATMRSSRRESLSYEKRSFSVIALMRSPISIPARVVRNQRS